MFTREDFLKGLQKLYPKRLLSDDGERVCYRLPFEEEEGGAPEEEEEQGFAFFLSELDELLESFPQDSTYENFSLSSPNSYECAVEELGRNNFMASLRFRLQHEQSALKIEQNGISLKFEHASARFIAAYVCSCAEAEDAERTALCPSFIMRTAKNLAEFCNAFALVTVTLSSENAIPAPRAKTAIQSYLFNVSYRYDWALALMGERTAERTARRRVRRSGQLYPYKAYNPDLLKYYNQGIATNIPFAQYLAFYHVLEFYFRTVSEDELFQEIQSVITRPSFSPYNKTDVKNFYKVLRKKFMTQRDNDVGDERNALLLCLKKYVADLDELKSLLSSLETNILDYYANNAVPFADEGGKIDFTASPEEVYAALQRRIYSVRNAIVHSKEGEKLRYEPFKHDKYLAKEIPLIRAVAEEIVINTGTPLKLD